MAAKLEKTRHPGIYKRGGRYVVVYRDGGGAQRKQATRTLDEARKVKAARTADVARGEFHPASRERFREYAEAWVERYQGTGRRGFRESTRDDYRRHLLEFAYPFFDDRRRRRLTDVTPSDVAEFVGWLCDESEQGRAFSDSTVRNILSPVRSCMASAVREGKVRHNPTIGASLPHRTKVADDDGEEVRALTREQLAALLAVVHPRHQVMFRLLASTGLRVSELFALQWQHLRLDGSEPCVRVRRALVRGRVQPPKSRHGRRDVPLGPSLIDALRAHRSASEWHRDGDLVFPSLSGTPLLVENVRRRVLRPAAEEASAPWAGFHTFRHTCASLLFARGMNVKQVQRWLGHHSPSFTLETYVHLLDEELPEPVDLDAEVAPRGNGVATTAASGELHAGEAESADTAT